MECSPHLLTLIRTQTRIVYERYSPTPGYLYPPEPQYLSHFQRLPWSALPRFLRYYLSKTIFLPSQSSLEGPPQGSDGDVHQVQQQLIVWRGIVLTVYLRIAGETALALQPEIPGRKYLRVLVGDLRAFRAGADDRDLTAEDVEELRQLIKTASARMKRPIFVTRGSPVSGGEAGDAVLLRIHPHGAKLQEAERPFRSW